MEIRHDQLRKSILKGYKTGVPLFAAGTTGIGKSRQIITTAAEIAKDIEKREFLEWNRISDTVKLRLEQEKAYRESVFLFIDFRISQISPEDLKGLPKLNGKDYVEWKPTMLFRVLSLEGVKAILFFDEMNLAPPSIQAAAYQIILDHCIGDIALNKDVYVIAAGNRSKDRANTFDMAAPLKNRFRHCTLAVPSVEEWVSWGMDNGIQDSIMAFLKFKPSHMMEDVEKLKDQSAFCSPRSWEFCNIITKDETDLDEIERYAAECVGDGAAIEYKAFMKLRETIDLDKVLEHPDLAKNLKLDMKWSLISLVSERFRTQKESKKKKDVLEKALGLCEYIEPDFGATMLRMVKRQDATAFFKMIFDCKGSQKVLDEYKKYLT